MTITVQQGANEWQVNTWHDNVVSLDGRMGHLVTGEQANGRAGQRATAVRRANGPVTQLSTQYLCR